MKAATAQTIADLASGMVLKRANLLAITLKTGAALYLTDFDIDITDPITAQLYSSKGPYPRITQMSWKIGVEVDELKLQLWAYQANTINSVAVLDSIRAQSWTDALIQIKRLWFPPFIPPAKPNFTGRAAVNMWQGNVGAIDEIDDVHAEITCRSRKARLSRQWPFHVYQPGCPWQFCGPGCELNPASFTTTGTVEAGSGTISLNTSLTAIDHAYDQGVITFTSGVNNGITRTIRFYLNAGGQVVLFLPLPNVPAVGDTFSALLGCARTQAACTAHGNLSHYGGQDCVPVPETGV
ncbi:MAG: DUF2163 domain-containing protein [Candidatus Acidiferrales bacterium]